MSDLALYTYYGVVFLYILYKIDLGFCRVDIIQKFTMPIRIYVDFINQADYDRIIDYYNANIPFDQPKLEILDRCEGGFQIQCPSDGGIDVNENIKQLRWNKKRLVPYSVYAGFSKYEEMMLFIAMRSVFGDCVTYEDGCE